MGVRLGNRLALGKRLALSGKKLAYLGKGLAHLGKGLGLIERS